MSDVHLTRRAFQDLRAIYEFSEQNWGVRIALAYRDEIYDALKEVARDPQQGRTRWHRSHPYLMAAVAKHFAIYEVASEGVIVATILHGRRDIEEILRQLEVELASEVQQVRNQIATKC